MKIIIAGGKTGGPVVPLLAAVRHIRQEHSHTQVLVVDTPRGVGRFLAQREGVRYQSIIAGKLRRYFTWRNIFTPIAVVIGFIQSLYILIRFQPDVALGAGGFVQVPVLWAARLLGIPVLIHQQDITPSLANNICAPIARKITVSFGLSLRHFSGGSGLFARPGHQGLKTTSKVVWTGNPFREEMKQVKRAEALRYFKLEPDRPVLLVTGGGGGAEGINQLVYKALPELLRAMQIIHNTGPGKSQMPLQAGYHPVEFVKRMDLAYAAADIVVSRAGVSTITELANLDKVSIIIPMPRTHQEYNAQLLFDANAAIILDQGRTTPAEFASIIRRLLFDPATQKLLRQNIKTIMPRNAAKKIAAEIMTLISHGK